MDQSYQQSHQGNPACAHRVRGQHAVCAGCFVLPIRLVFLLAGTLIAGCGGRSGPQQHDVSGRVTFAGEEVAEGTIAFVPIGETKGPKVGANIQQGQYHIDRRGGPVAGRHRVEITWLRKTGRKLPDMGGRGLVDQVDNVLPVEYSGETSELVVEIQAGVKNIFDFDLKRR